MFSRYIFYKDAKNKKKLSVWSFVQSHEDYMKASNILQTKEGTDWKKVISMGYLRLDLENKKLCVVALLNKDERYVSQYLQQIKLALEELYPETPRMDEVIRQDVNVMSDKKNSVLKQNKRQEGR